VLPPRDAGAIRLHGPGAAGLSADERRAGAFQFCPVLGGFITEHDLKREEEVSGLEGKQKMEMSFSDFDPPRPI
jgi:hypothetical protein